MMNVFVFSGLEVTTKEERLDALEKRRVSRHHIFKLPVLRTRLSHHDVAVGFEYLRFDLTGMLEHQRVERHFTGDHRVANFFYAGWTETIGLAWETKWGGRALVRLEPRTRRPDRAKRFTFRESLVDGLKRFPRDIREAGNQPGAFHSRQLTFF